MGCKRGARRANKGPASADGEGGTQGDPKKRVVRLPGARRAPTLSIAKQRAHNRLKQFKDYLGRDDDCLTAFFALVSRICTGSIAATFGERTREW